MIKKKPAFELDSSTLKLLFPLQMGWGGGVTENCLHQVRFIEAAISTRLSSAKNQAFGSQVLLPIIPLREKGCLLCSAFQNTHT